MCVVIPIWKGFILERSLTFFWFTKKRKTMSASAVESTIFFYFKGTPLDLTHVSDGPEKSLELLKQLAHQMITDGIRDGISLTQQGDEYYDQLVRMENFLRVATGKAVGGRITQKHIEIVAKQCNLENALSLKSMWALNILALLELRRLEDDEMNGVQFLNMY